MKLIIEDGHISACAAYRAVGGYKLQAIASDQTPLGKENVKKIIKQDIEQYKDWYWAEVSGAVEHIYKKYGGYPLPNIYAEEVLQRPITRLLDDGAHYIRTIGQDNIEFTKIIYGFKDEELYIKVMNEVANYEDFAKRINSITEGTKKYDISIKKSIFIIENIYCFHTEEGFNELPPQWHSWLVNSIQTLEQSNIEDNTIIQYIELGHHLIDIMPILIPIRT